MHITQEQYSYTKSYLNKLKQYPNFVKDILATVLATTGGEFIFAPIHIYLYMKLTQQKQGHTIDSDRIKRISMDRYKSCLRTFIVLLPFKDYLRGKFSFLKQAKEKSQLTKVEILYCFMINCSCVSLIGSIRAVFLFTFGRHQIEQVNFYIQEQQRRKYYQEQGKSKKFITRELLKARNNGLLTFLLAAGGFGTLSISLFDTMTILSRKTESKSQQFLYHFCAGFLFYSISEMLCLPFVLATRIKRKQIIIKDPSKPYLFQSLSYKQIWLKIWKNKQSLIPKSRLYPYYLLTWARNSFILSAYYHINEYIMANSTSY